MNSNELQEAFDAYYFEHCCGRPYARDEQWLGFFGEIAERIVKDIQPDSVLDAGCAWGFLVEKLREKGVKSYGIDISKYAIENIHPDIEEFCKVGSVTEPFPEIYDLIVCIEVLEHMPKDEAEKAVENFCKHATDVLFSSTPFDYKEATHINVQPPEYWAELFARSGFFRDVEFDAGFITPWAVRFRKRSEPISRLVREYERQFFLISKENADLRSLSLEMREKISQLDQSVKSMQTELDNRELQQQILDRELTDIYSSRGWTALQKFQDMRKSIAPPGSRREKIYKRIVGANES
jgi:SAM-dependent methyltransferase